MLDVLGWMNRTPKVHRPECDFARVWGHLLEGEGAPMRQTIVMSAQPDPLTALLFAPPPPSSATAAKASSRPAKAGGGGGDARFELSDSDENDDDDDDDDDLDDDDLDDDEQGRSGGGRGLCRNRSGCLKVRVRQYADAECAVSASMEVLPTSVSHQFTRIGGCDAEEAAAGGRELDPDDVRFRHFERKPVRP